LWGYGNYVRLVSAADHGSAIAVILDNPEDAPVKGEHVNLSQHSAPVPAEDLHHIPPAQL
jgi:hypothetical protein